MTETIPTSEVLNRAADLIEERGWGHGPTSMVGEAGICAMGAIYLSSTGRLAVRDQDEVAYAHVEMCGAGKAMAAYLALEDGGQIWRWNDVDVDRSEGQRHVIEVLRACAVIEASRERESVSA